MQILLLGHGKTGSLVEQVAREREHHVHILTSTENSGAAALTPENLAKIDVAIDFTTPAAVLENIRACAAAGKNIVVGTTGWYADLPRVQEMVRESGIGLLYASNFSIGVNLFFEIARIASDAFSHHYTGQIMERHHAQKKDAPSGTALSLQKIIRDSCGEELEIVSFREGEVVGMHEIILNSPNDTIYLSHDAKSRRGFADGAVRAAEWLVNKRGLFDFRDVWREL
jgi:4-hydroxy-tetrahydrodipicolinate reductase